MDNRREHLQKLIGMVDIDIEKAKQEMQETFQVIRDVNDIKLKDAYTRNIIFVGRSRSGKSTALRVMKDPGYKVKPISLYSETLGATVYSFTVSADTARSSQPVRLVDGRVYRSGACADVADACADNNNNNNNSDGNNMDAYAAAASASNATIRPYNPVSADDAGVTNYNINIIDTPGLNEVLEKGMESQVRSNEQLKQIILKCMDHEITKLQAIFFVCNFANGVNNDDIIAFTEFLSLFEGSEQAICMLITNAEKYNQERKKMLVDQINQHPKMSQFMSQFNGRVFFTGSISEADYNSGLVGAVQTSALNVMEMRRELYNFIFACEQDFSLRDIKFYKDQQRMAQTLQERVTAIETELAAKSKDPEAYKLLQKEKVELVRDLDKLKGFLESRMNSQATTAATTTSSSAASTAAGTTGTTVTATVAAASR